MHVASQTARHVLLTATIALFAAGDASANPTVGLELENMLYNVTSLSDIKVLTASNKRLLCAKIPMKTFDKDFNLLEVTYDRMLTPEKTEARLEYAVGPISLCDLASWKSLEDRINAFIKSMRGTLTETLSNLQTSDRSGKWDFCSDAVRGYADKVGFAIAKKLTGSEWDTQTNIQVALGQIPNLYVEMIPSVFSISLQEKGFEGIVRVLNELILSGKTGDDSPQAPRLTREEKGFLYLYFISRALLVNGPVPEEQHADVKNRLGLFPKARIMDLIPHVDAARMKTFITRYSAEILKGTNDIKDPEFASFTTDRFGVAQISNPILPFKDKANNVFIVFESRNPMDILNRYMSPSDKIKTFGLVFGNLERAKLKLEMLDAPNYTGTVESSCSVQ